jgi:hypothetical protein
MRIHQTSPLFWTSSQTDVGPSLHVIYLPYGVALAVVLLVLYTTHLFLPYAEIVLLTVCAIVSD